MTGNIRSAPKASFIIGNSKANRIRLTGNASLLANAPLLSPTPPHRRAVSQESSWPEDQDQYQDAKDHHIRPPDTDVLVVHRTNNAYQYAAHNRPGEVSDAAQNRRREREEPLPETQIEDGGAVEEPEH